MTIRDDVGKDCSGGKEGDPIEAKQYKMKFSSMPNPKRKLNQELEVLVGSDKPVKYEQVFMDEHLFGKPNHGLRRFIDEDEQTIGKALSEA